VAAMSPTNTEGVLGDHIDQMRGAIEEAATSGNEAVRRVEEAVGFLSRTKATGYTRVRRRTEAVAVLWAVYEGEVEEMRVVSSSTSRERNG
jgi:exocyst complex component 7